MEGNDGDQVEGGPPEVGARDEERILVSVRVRPLSEREMLRNEVVDWECASDTTIIYKNQSYLERSMYPSSYTFDRVFSWDCSTRQVYEEGARTVVLSAVRGINSSVFAYGQTSSGKTYTMYGITEYTMEDIFDYIHKHTEREFRLRFSAMEIYNESVRDLLTKDSSPLKLLDDPERGTVVERLTEETLRDWNHFKELLAVCEAQRQIGETNLNEVSSRSHQILRLTIESSTREYLGKSNSSTLTATLNFVDLAGSERASQALSAGSRLKEGSHINRSLLTLGTVIRKLSKGRSGHIPYRDSKLTRILQSSLGGNARTAVVCTMSPARSYVDQSRNTLLFASCAKEVTTNARVNVVVSDKVLVKHLQKELARLQSELKMAGPSGGGEDAAHLLREKESIIEQLEGHIRELTLQLDDALSKIHELEHEVEERRLTIWEQEGDESSYPKLLVRPTTPDSSPSNNTTVTDHCSFDGRSMASRASQSPDRHSRISYDEDYSGSDADENLPSASPFDGMFVEADSDISSHIFIHPPNPKVKVEPYFVEFDPYQVSDELASCVTGEYRVSRGALEERHGYESEDSVHKNGHECENESHGYESEGSVQNEGNVHGTTDPQETQEEADREQDDELFEDERHVHGTTDPLETPGEADREQNHELPEDECKEVQCIEENPSPLSSTGHENDRCIDEGTEHETGVKYLETSVDGQGDAAHEFEGVNCVDCGSDRSNSRGSSACSFVVEKVMFEIINECGHEGAEPAIGTEDCERKISSSKYDDPENEVSLDETPVTDIRVLSDIDSAEKSVRFTEMDEITEPKCIEKLPDHQMEDTVDETKKPVKIMKDVGLSPQDDLDAITDWQSDLNELQNRIIDLWQTCSVPLVYRTQFFMLFVKGDPSDAVYMEVERRRLSCIVDAFSNGHPIVLDGRKLTPSSSRKALHKERNMLARRMKRRLSSNERSDLFVRWGIRLNSKDRCTQLAHRLWTNTTDMNHIICSADLVARLVRFNRPPVPKEVFGLNMKTAPARRKSFSLL